MIPAEYAGVYIGRILKSDARPGLTGVANTPIEAFVMKHDCIYHQYRVEWRKDTNPEQVIETEVLKDSEVAKIATPEFVKEAWVLTDILRLQQANWNVKAAAEIKHPEVKHMSFELPQLVCPTAPPVPDHPGWQPSSVYAPGLDDRYDSGLAALQRQQQQGTQKQTQNKAAVPQSAHQSRVLGTEAAAGSDGSSSEGKGEDEDEDEDEDDDEEMQDAAEEREAGSGRSSPSEYHSAESGDDETTSVAQPEPSAKQPAAALKPACKAGKNATARTVPAAAQPVKQPVAPRARPTAEQRAAARSAPAKPAAKRSTSAAASGSHTTTDSPAVQASSPAAAAADTVIAPPAAVAAPAPAAPVPDAGKAPGKSPSRKRRRASLVMPRRTPRAPKQAQAHTAEAPEASHDTGKAAGALQVTPGGGMPAEVYEQPQRAFDVTLPDGHVVSSLDIWRPGDKRTAEYSGQETGGDYEPEKILHQRKAGSGMQLLVKWVGYELDPEGWEPARELRHLKLYKDWSAEQARRQTHLD